MTNARVSPVRHRLRVLEVVGNAIVGGMETAVLRLATALAPVCALHAVCPFESDFSERLRRVCDDVLIAPLTEPLRWHGIQAVAQWTRAHGIDVLHAHHGLAHPIAALAGRVCERPVLATIHSMHLSMMDLEAHRLGGTHLCMVSSAAHTHALAVGAAPERTHLIRNGIDPEAFAPRAPACERRDAADAVTVGFVGRLSPEKNPGLFVRAAALVRKRHPRVRFVVVGEGPLRGEVEAEARALGLSRAIRFDGVRTDMAQVYRELDAVALCSWHEGTPLVVLEAMAAGLPVVATDVGGVAELIVAGSTGFLVPAGDDAALASRLGALVADRALRGAMGLAGRRHVTRAHSLERQAALTAALLSRVAGAAPRGALVSVDSAPA